MDINDADQCRGDTKDCSGLIKDSESNLENNSTENSDTVAVQEVINPQNTSETTVDSEKQNYNCTASNEIQKPEDYLPTENLGNEHCNLNKCESEKSESNGKLSEAVVKVSKPLCADYRSDSDSESVDSESDSSLSSSDSSTDTSSDSEDDSDDSCSSTSIKNKSNQDNKTTKRELTIYDLPPIEDLRISIPEEDCLEVGTITSIVDTLVVVESYKGTAALDIDTVLFLDNGKRTLGKVFDILGPITEPVYAVRFNSQEQIKDLNIEKGLKVFYAPKTKHTNFVFMSEVLKNKGSDASWKDNAEAPPEFQDFSDDEEERLHRQKHVKESDGENSNMREQNKSRKRPFTHFKQNRNPQMNSFRQPNFSPQTRPNFQRYPPVNQYTPPNAFIRPNNPYPYTPYQGPVPPHMFLPFGRMPFVSQNQNFQPYYQQRAHPGPQSYGGWGMMLRPPPPPPPPATQQSDHQQQGSS